MLNGKLLNDGSSGSRILAPYDLTNIPNYKVEVKMQMINETGGIDSMFEIDARYTATSNQGYGVALNTNYQTHNNIVALSIWTMSRSYPPIASTGFELKDDIEYTFDVVVQDNHIKVYINGGSVPLLDVTDNTYLSGTSVGLWVQDQVSITSFKIIAV